MAEQGRFQPAILGGVFIGVLSSIPLVSSLNLCCCLWVVLGGLLTTYLAQQKKPEPIETADAILGGLIAGLIGAVITAVLAGLIISWTGPLWQERFRDTLESNGQMPQEMRDWILRLMTGRGLMVVYLAINIPVYAIFGMLGSLLGVAIFKKKTPPPTA